AVPVTVGGGQYRLVLCIDFRVDAGVFTLVGMSPFNQITKTFLWLEDRTCIAGEAAVCFAGGFSGHQLSANDRSNWIETGVPINRENSSVQAGSLSAPPSKEESTGNVAGFDVGGLFLLGPSPLEQHRTCISGQSCPMSDLQGFAMPLESQVVVLDTCGLSAALPLSTPVPAALDGRDQFVAKLLAHHASWWSVPTLLVQWHFEARGSLLGVGDLWIAYNLTQIPFI
ncbi:agaA33, partial [Symbiodinium pilosum]